MSRRPLGDSSAGPTTYIAASTLIVGEVSGKGSHVVRGRVEGKCDVDGSVTLAEGARWKGTLRATDVLIAGTVEGDVVAGQRVEIAGTARITGSLAGHSIAVGEGAVIEGDIKVTDGTGP